MPDKTKVGAHIYRNDDGDVNVDVTHFDISLASIQKLVGGYFENVKIPGLPTCHAYVDEDGLRKHLPVNPVASALAGRTIVGPMLIFGNGKSGTEGDVPGDIYELLKKHGIG